MSGRDFAETLEMRRCLESFTEATSIHTSHLENQTKVFEKVLKNLEVLSRKIAKIEGLQQTSTTKLTCHEKRYCELRGEGTDSARMLDEYCRAASALCSRILLLLLLIY